MEPAASDDETSAASAYDYLFWNRSGGSDDDDDSDDNSDRSSSESSSSSSKDEARLEYARYLAERARNKAKFEALCEALSRNDPSFTRIVDLFGLPHGKGPALASALRSGSGNTRVEHISLLTSIVLNVRGDDAVDHGEIEELLLYVQESKSLRSFHLEECQNSNAMAMATAAEWMNAVAQNGNIQEFHYIVDDFLFQPPLQATLQFLKASRCSLLRLKLPMCAYPDRELYFQALSDMPSLEAIDFYNIVVDRHPPEEAAAIAIGATATAATTLIQHVSSRLVRLCSVALQLKSNDGIFVATPMSVTQAISSLLQTRTSATPHRLTDFSLTHHSFDKEGMECLVQGLRGSPTLSKLGLKYCTFTDDAKAEFIRYMQQENGISVVNGIRSFVLEAAWPYQNLPLTQLIIGPRGCGLETVDVNFKSSRGGLWDGLKSIVRRQSRQLTSLSVAQFFGETQCTLLVRHLPNLVYLRSLDVSYHSTGGGLGKVKRRLKKLRLLDAIRRNGSLYTAMARRGTSNSTTDLCLWSTKEARLVTAFGQRNRHLPALLRNPYDDTKKMKSLNNSNVPSETSIDAATADTTAPPPRAHYSLVPTLNLVSCDTPRMALHHVFTGLVAMNDSINGPNTTMMTTTTTTTPTKTSAPLRKRPLSAV